MDNELNGQRRAAQEASRGMRIGVATLLEATPVPYVRPRAPIEGLKRSQSGQKENRKPEG
eukprot:648728-Heterocapsa_arctica.AAC.1